MSTLAPMPGGKPDMAISAPSAQPSPYTKLVQKHAIKAADPAFMPHMARRQVPQERVGAAYQVKVSNAPLIDPSAGSTLSRGRIIAPAINRSNINFQSGMLDF